MWSSSKTEVPLLDDTTSDVTGGISVMAVTAEKASSTPPLDTRRRLRTLWGGGCSATVSDYTLLIKSSSSAFWSTALAESAKSFSIAVYDNIANVGVSGESIIVTDDDGISLQCNPDSVSDDSGILNVFIAFPKATAEMDSITLTFALTSDTTVSVNFFIEFVAPRLIAPVYPLANNFVIDDAGIAAGVQAVIPTSRLTNNGILYLHINDDIIEYTVTDGDIETDFIAIPIDETYLNNEIKISYYYFVEFSGNTLFSEVTKFIVKRNSDMSSTAYMILDCKGYGKEGVELAHALAQLPITDYPQKFEFRWGNKSCSLTCRFKDINSP